MSYLSDLLGDAYKEGMTEEEISTALQSAGAGAKDNEAEVNRLKAQLSKANSEAADYKKQLRGKQSEDEAAAADTATAMVDGDMDKVMANQTKYLEAREKDILAKKMKGTPRPAAGSENTGGMDYQKKIEEAQASGDLTAVAYYTRLAAQDAADQTE